MPTLPTIRVGSTGSVERDLQMELNGLGLNYNDMAIDGEFNNKTSDVLKEFRDRFDIVLDGVAGPVTWTRYISLALSCLGT